MVALLIKQIELPIAAVIVGLFLYAGLKSVKIVQTQTVVATEVDELKVDHANTVAATGLYVTADNTQIHNSVFNAPDVQINEVTKNPLI